MSKRGHLIIYSGPSGVGKGTVREVFSKDDTLNLAYSISMTSRERRPLEKEGIDYFFITREAFEEKIKNNEFLEYAEFVGNYYGTPLSYVNKLLDEGKNVVLEIETKGALEVMKKVPEAISIFLLPPSLEALENRLKNRATETEETIRYRLNRAKDEIACKDQYMYHVVNNDINEAAKEIADIIRSQM